MAVASSGEGSHGRIAEWFRGRSLLVTGGSGFIGKVLLEKLLRSLPQLGTVYVLLRGKRGDSPAARLENIKRLPLFDRLRRTDPSALERLQAVEGDVLRADLGLQPPDRARLLAEVSVVFHCAATLRLEAGLKAAIEHNTAGTLRLLHLCRRMRHLQVIVHLSTAFCHCEQEVLEEKIYPPPHDPHDIMHLVQWLDEESLASITPKLLGPHPNCYTYSKRLAESLVYEESKNLPAVICRPSIVTPVFNEPLTGWVDNLNGPVGILVGAGKGVIRSMLCGPDFCTEIIPVDIAVNGIITAAWDTAVRRPDEMPVYNLSTSSLVQITWGEVLERGRQIVYENPFEGAVWYPDGNIRTNQTVHYLHVLLFHIFPAYVIDFLLLLAMQKRFMVRLQNRISNGLKVLQYFTLRQWNFDNKEILELSSRMTKEDCETFYMANVEYDVDSYLLACVLGARQYCMKEPLSSLPRARRHLKMLYWLDWLVKMMCIGFLLYVMYQYARPSKALVISSVDGMKLSGVISSFIS
ncbi:putative fatty acyl-CoA reductase CG5065 isoform X1 [Schistocerca gregaria]|uniref:putative fatty acyl-CoA reductase CG5065 isoform X1 n=1 Tax=Schistocerca gregaria TaxID=7010 RepID=UPI00211DFDBA|nr:putative fatty acyl-CoA reductase CG5065 isoform X1 [Schistocerca gregaria]XP_049861197.1 putative fatty acyl-CoA reductase CG5065 isoform X1 [Schistocerca gregaria]